MAAGVTVPTVPLLTEISPQDVACVIDARTNDLVHDLSSMVGDDVVVSLIIGFGIGIGSVAFCECLRQLVRVLAKTFGLHSQE